MLEKNITRRALLLSGATAGSLLAVSGCSKPPVGTTTGCVDPEQLSDSHLGLRTSMNYTGASSDPARVCEGCAFFHAAPSAPACGTCDVLLGPVDAKGYCDSWSRKA